MISDPNYETRTLLAPFEQGPVVPTFLRDTFFQGREYPPTNLIEFDFRRGKRKMAPFVAPLIGGKVMERRGFETRYFKAPRIAPIRNLRIPDLEPRMFGETIYAGGTAASRAATLLAEDAVFCDEAISRREEWMARELLVHGKITVTADHGYVMVIDYLESGGGPVSNQYTPAIQWNNLTTATPLDDLEAARLLAIKESGISPDIALFGTDAKSAFINNTSVKALLDIRRFELGNVAPRIDSPSVVRFASVPGIECYAYSEYFEDDAGTLFPMLPPNAVLLLSSSVQNKIVYGAFTQLEDAKAKRFVTYQTSRIPFVYGDEENGALFYRLTSCPLPMPADILGMRVILALPGPLTVEAPFFAGMQARTDRGAAAEDAANDVATALQKGHAVTSASTLGAQVETDDEPVLNKVHESKGRVAGEHSDQHEDNMSAKELQENYDAAELKELAEQEGVELKGASTKAEVAKAIVKHRKAKAKEQEKD